MMLDLAGLRSVRVPDPRRLSALATVDAVVVVGSTCVGKTTIVDALRRSDLTRSGAVVVPARFVTRPPREGDCLVENVHLAEEEFLSRVRAGTIDLHWRRVMENGRTIRYGFEPPRGGALAVYSANNAIYAPSSDVRPEGRLAHALLVGVHAPDDVRAERLRRRSPDLWAARPDEARHRLAERASSVAPHVHAVIENHGELEAVAPGDFVRLVERVAAAARGS